MVPKLWDGLDTAEPRSLALTLDDAFAFLKEWAWVLEDAGFKLVQFRGQWVELDRDQMQEMLAFWRRHGQETPEMGIQNLLARTLAPTGRARAALTHAYRPSENCDLRLKFCICGLQFFAKYPARRGPRWAAGVGAIIIVCIDFFRCLGSTWRIGHHG